MRVWLTLGAVLIVALPARAQIVVYDSNPRIIHVPQSTPPRAAVMPADDVRAERARRVEKKPQPRRSLSEAAESVPLPKRIEPPPASEPKRAVLTAPAYGPGSLTPIYPTPRWSDAGPAPPVAAGNDE